LSGQMGKILFKKAKHGGEGGVFEGKGLELEEKERGYVFRGKKKKSDFQRMEDVPPRLGVNEDGMFTRRSF